MQKLNYPLFEGRYVNRWLITDIALEDVAFAPVTLEGEYDELLKTGLAFFDNPCKTEFLEKRQAEGPPQVIAQQPAPGSTVEWSGQKHTLGVFYPFDDTTVDLSHFWSTPTHVSAYATTILVTPQAQTVSLEIKTCGGANMWLNGQQLLRFEPFTRNTSAFSTVEAQLQAGENRIDVWWDDLAERDTSYYFRLACDGGQGIQQAVPVGQRDPARLKQVEKAMEGLSFVRNHFTSGEVTVRCDNPFPNESFVISFNGATEENAKVGEPFSRTARLEPGKHRASLGPIEDFPLGFLRFWAETEVDGIAIGRRITMESHPLSVYPPAAPTVPQRKKQALEFLAKYGEANANMAIAMLYAGGERERIEELMYRQIKFIDDRNDCSDFYLILFPHVVKHFWGDERMSDELKQAMRSCILNFRYWIDEPGNDVMWFFSENHALLFHICQLLCGELYPDEIFTNSGLTGRQMQEKATARLHRWFDIFFAEGFTEWNSPAYLPIDSLGFACLYDGTQNPELKDKARRGLNYIYRMMAIYGINGCFASTAGRTYLKELMGNWSNCTSFMSYIGYGTGNMGHAGKGSLPLCFSDYEPPAEYAPWQTPQPGTALLCQSTQGINGFANLYCYKTHGYVLGTACNFRPGQHGHQENPIQLTFTPVAQLWVNHPGEKAIYGSGRPSYWAGNGILPRVKQYKGFASVVYDIDNDDPVDFTHLYFPTMEFHICRHQGSWLFGEENGYFCAVYSAGGLQPQATGPNTDREFISPGRRNIWLVRAAGPEEFADFDDFVAQMKAMQINTDLDALSFDVQDPVYGHLLGGMKASLSVDGTPVVYTGHSSDGTLTWM